MPIKQFAQGLFLAVLPLSRKTASCASIGQQRVERRHIARRKADKSVGDAGPKRTANSGPMSGHPMARSEGLPSCVSQIYAVSGAIHTVGIAAASFTCPSSTLAHFTGLTKAKWNVRTIIRHATGTASTPT